MGYRSDVALGIVFTDKGKLKDFALKVMAFQPEDVRKALAEYNQDENELPVGFIFASFLGTKWYDSYPDVHGHVALQDFAREHGACTAYVRAGEEPNDMESDFMEPSIDGDCFDTEEVAQLIQFLYDSFGVVTRIEYPQGGKPLEFN